MIRHLVLAVSLFAAPALAETVEIETALGPVSAESTPQNVAVYDMAALDMLDALKVDGLTSINAILLAYLQEYEGDLGTLHEPDYEALYGAKPDLVVAGGRSSTKVKDLSKIAPTLDMTIDGTEFLSQIKSRMGAFGTLFDKDQEAAALIAQLEAQVQATSEAMVGKGTGLILLTNGPKISVYGPGSRFGWIHAELGLPEASSGIDASTHGEAVSFEFINKTQPDWILVVDRVAAIGAEGATAAATLDNALVHDTPAWKEGQVVYLNAQELYIAGGGIQSIMHTLQQLEAAFNGGTS